MGCPYGAWYGSSFVFIFRSSAAPEPPLRCALARIKLLSGMFNPAGLWWRNYVHIIVFSSAASKPPLHPQLKCIFNSGPDSWPQVSSDELTWWAVNRVFSGLRGLGGPQGQSAISATAMLSSRCSSTVALAYWMWRYPPQQNVLHCAVKQKAPSLPMMDSTFFSCVLNVEGREWVGHIFFFLKKNLNYILLLISSRK